MIKHTKNIIFLGPPGTGKGTISAILIDKLNLKHISTGDIFREEIKNKTQLGLEIAKIVASGGYVVDDITNEIVRKHITQLKKDHINYILDGYPRTIEQADFLSCLNQDEFLVILLTLSEKKIIERLSQRLFCTMCKRTFNTSSMKSKKHPYCEHENNLLITRLDDQPSSIVKRLQVYNDQTKVLINYYQNKGILHEIDVDQSIEEILAKIEELYYR